MNGFFIATVTYIIYNPVFGVHIDARGDIADKIID